MIVEEGQNWQSFCQWLFDQPETLNRLRAATDFQQLSDDLVVLAASRNFSLQPSEIAAQARELQLLWLQRWL